MFLICGDGMNIAAIVAAALVAAVLSVIIRQYKPEYAMFISVATGVLILAAIISAIEPVLEIIKSLTSQAGAESVYGEALLKALAVCYITQLARDCCRDAGEAAIGTKLEMAGRLEILLISLPMFQGLIQTVTELIIT